MTTDPEERKRIPIATGVLDYFPRAIVEVAKVSYMGSKQHHPDEPLHWDKSKSTDHADALMRHFMKRGTLDSDGMKETAKVAWRALAMLEEELAKSPLVPKPMLVKSAITKPISHDDRIGG